jgi:isoleucyl-tRNA synthetase
VKVRLKPDAKKIGPRAGRYLKVISEALENADPGQVLKSGPFSIELADQTFELAPEEIIVSFEGPENLKCSLEQGTFLALDTTLTPELLREGLARDFNRMLQDQRKALNLDISDRIVVSYTASPRIAEAIRAHEGFLRNELLAERLEMSSAQNGGVKLALSGEDIFVTITRV